MILNPWQTLATGLLATLTMDLLTGLATLLKLAAPLPPGLVGRWFSSIGRAQWFHADIAHSSPVNHELLIALPVHYTIGTILTMLYVWGTVAIGSHRSLGLALVFGLSTSILPWFLMFPAMGYGVFGVHGPHGTRLFVTSLVSHLFFGVGLWIAVGAMRLS